MPWDPRFAGRSPIFEPYARCARRFEACARWPSREALDALLAAEGVRNARGLPLRAVAPDNAGALSYEARVDERGALAVRDGDWHDLLNVLAWCVFPRTKAALNAQHVAAARAESDRPNRGRTRDALTLFDESGAIVASSEPDLIEDLREFRWKTLFGTERDRVRASLRVYVVGHALLEKALAPYVGITAHAMTLHVDAALFDLDPQVRVARIDEAAAAHVAALGTPRDLAPLPLLGVPGWWPANENPAFYDDVGYFRPGRRKSRRNER